MWACVASSDRRLTSQKASWIQTTHVRYSLRAMCCRIPSMLSDDDILPARSGCRLIVLHHMYILSAHPSRLADLSVRRDCSLFWSSCQTDKFTVHACLYRPSKKVFLEHALEIIRPAHAVAARARAAKRPLSQRRALFTSAIITRQSPLVATCPSPSSPDSAF